MFLKFKNMSDSKLPHKQLYSIPERLKKLRKRLNLSQIEMAEKMEVTRSYWSALERGNRELSGGILRKLIVSFRVSADWLLTGKEFPSQDNTKLNSEDINRKVD